MKWDDLPQDQRDDLLAWLRMTVAEWRRLYGKEPLPGADSLDAAIEKLSDVPRT